MTVKISKKGEEVMLQKVEKEITFLVNGKTVRVYMYQDNGPSEQNDFEINEADLKALTEEEREAFDEEGMWNLADLKDKEELIIENN